MKYNVGDKVRIKSLDWYNENKDEDGDVPCREFDFVSKMSVFCGKILTIDVDFEDGTYLMKEDTDGFIFEDEMIEGFVKDEMPLNIDDFQDDNEMGDVIDEHVHRLKDNECQINLPEGYQFTDENGNVINATKIVLEKKKKEYPKTYERCCEVLDIDAYDLVLSIDYRSNKMKHNDWKRLEKLNALNQIFICRDAYWKLYGEEMGLGKPWEPEDLRYVYSFFRWDGDITISNTCYGNNHIFEFPTEEMRDMFYENFKELIEICKELL